MLFYTYIFFCIITLNNNRAQHGTPEPGLPEAREPSRQVTEAPQVRGAGASLVTPPYITIVFADVETCVNVETIAAML